MATFVILLIKRRITVNLLKKSFLSTIVISSMSCMLIAGSSLINFIFNYLSVPAMLSEAVTSMALTPLTVFILVVILYLILGMFIDGISMVVLTAATVCPLMVSLGFDSVWLGIILVLLVEIALVTPPVGVNLYVLAGISEKASFAPDLPGGDPLHRGAADHDRPSVYVSAARPLAAQHDVAGSPDEVADRKTGGRRPPFG